MRKGKYYWLKQGLDYYDNEAIDWLCSLPNGGNFIVLYQRLCILAVKNGKDSIIRHVTDELEVPYKVDELARAIKYDLNIVTAGIPILLQIRLLELRDDGSYYIPGLKKMVGRDSDKAKEKKLSKEKIEHIRELARMRKRKSRANQKLRALAEGKGEQPKLNAPAKSRKGNIPPAAPNMVLPETAVPGVPYTGMGPVEILPPNYPPNFPPMPGINTPGVNNLPGVNNRKRKNK